MTAHTIDASTPATSRLWMAVFAILLAATGAFASGRTAFADENIVFDGAGNAAHISLVGDSTLAGVRWYSDYGALRRFNFVLNAESCRRTIELSCISREGYRSENAIAAMRSLNGELGEVVVIMSGYNDPVWTIGDAIDGVVEEARSQGAEHVIWLTLRTSGDVDYSDPQEQSSIATFQEYNEQLVAAADASNGFLQVADWATYSLGATAWFEQDGVHLTTDGVDAVTTFIASVVDRVLAGENVSPAEAPWTVLVPGAEGDSVAAVQQAVIDAGVDVPGGADGVYGNDTMVAVAEYQRQAGDLLVTGAVDISTARSLGVYTDSDEAAAAATETEAATDPDVAPRAPQASAGLSDELDATQNVADAGDGSVSWRMIVGFAAAALTGAVVVRRRHVVARRRCGRQERVDAGEEVDLLEHREPGHSANQ